MNLRICALAAFAALSFPAVAAPDPLKDRLLAAARAAPPIAMTCTTVVEESDAKETERETRVERWDGGKPASERWTLLSANGRAATAKEVASHRKDRAKGKPPGYVNVAQFLGPSAVRATAPDGRIVYRTSPAPPGSFKVSGKDQSRHVAVEAMVSEGSAPFIQQYRYKSIEPFRMMMVAKIERIESASTYRLAGVHPVPVGNRTEMDGSMMGSAGKIVTTTTCPDARPLN